MSNRMKKAYVSFESVAPIIEQAYQSNTLIGVDEAGRGPLAGPVFAAAAYIPAHIEIPLYIQDSKKLSATKRAQAFQWIQKEITYAWAAASVEEIQRFNILQATQYASKRALYLLLRKLNGQSFTVATDALALELAINSLRIISIAKADTHIAAVSAASIVAKEMRDKYMNTVGILSGFDFTSHKGYGTLAHKNTLQKNGYSVLHRLDYIKTFLS